MPLIVKGDITQRSLTDIHAVFTHAVQRHDAELLQRVIEEFAAIDVPEAQAYAALGRGVLFYLGGRFEEAINTLHSALDTQHSSKAPLYQAKVLNTLGQVYHDTQQLPDALHMYLKALEIGVQESNVELQGAMHNNIGEIYALHGQYAKALEHLHKALDMHAAAGGRLGIGRTLMNIAETHASLHDHAAAIARAQEALVIFEEEQFTSAIPRVCIHIAMQLMFGSNENEVWVWVRRSLDLVQDVNDPYTRATVARIASLCYFNAGNFEEMHEIHERFNDDIQLFPKEVEVVAEMKARVMTAQGNHTAAREIFQGLLRNAEEHGEVFNITELHRALRDLAKDTGDFESYVKHNETHQRLFDETRGAQVARNIAIQEAEAKAAKESERMANERELMAKERERERNERERERTVLYSTLPKHIADRVIRGEEVTDHIDAASVIFLDIVGFTTLSSALTSQQVSTLLDAVFGTCDEACARNGVTRIKTIGDSYLAFGE